MSRTAPAVDKAKNGTKEGVRQVAANPWAERLMRFGYVARGVVYIIPGLLALQLAMGVSGGRAITQTGAIAYIGAQPYGKILLVLMAIGLAGYSLWGLVRAVIDPFRKGSDAEGLAARFGYIVSAFGYGTLLIATLQYISGSAMSSNNPQDWTVKLLAEPFGRIAVGIIGLGWILGGGLKQIYDAYKANFVKELKTNEMSPLERVWSVRIGRFGMAARGVVFAMLGLFLVQAAVSVNPSRAQGLDGAVIALAQQPYGPWLLAIVALGLIAFGVFSILYARWLRYRVPKQQTAQ